MENFVFWGSGPIISLEHIFICEIFFIKSVFSNLIDFLVKDGSEMFLGLYQTSMIDHYCKGSRQLKAVKYVHRNASSETFDRVRRCDNVGFWLSFGRDAGQR